MADDYMSLADLVLINDRNLADIDVTDLLDDAPFLAALNADTASNGTDHKYVKETGAPVVGFRAVNAGRDHDVSEDTLVTINLQILDASFTVDLALADMYKNGRDALLGREARRHLKAAFFKAEQQLIYGTGTGGDAAGFTGMADAATVDALADAMVVNAAGTTPSTASSVWLVRSTSDNTNVTAIIGQSGQISIGETAVQRVEDGSGLHYPAYHTPITGWLGMQIGSIYSVGRIANVTEDLGSTLDDDMLYDGISKFPTTRPPTHIVMGRRSLFQLRASRTATNATGAPAPIPDSVAGIPIVVSDAVLENEALLT